MPPKHGINLVKLGRDSAHRRALFRNQVTSLLKHERIQTTFPKAMALRRIADWMITLGKKQTVQAQQKASSYITESDVTHKVFATLAERYKFRPGGYTRVIRTRQRPGDGAIMAYIELVDRPEELRPARTTDFTYAVEKGFVPAPADGIIPDDPELLAQLAAASPSTSQSEKTLKQPKATFLRHVRDGKQSRETYNEKYMSVAPKYSLLENPFVFAKSDNKIANYLTRLEAKRTQEQGGHSGSPTAAGASNAPHTE